VQARQLQVDIERSKVIARDIVRDHEAGKGLSAAVRDADAKLRLLRGETLFNEAITSSLEEIWRTSQELDLAESTLAAGELLGLATTIPQLTMRVERLMKSNAKDINRDRLTRLQEAVVEDLKTATISMVDFHKVDGQPRVAVNHRTHGTYNAIMVSKQRTNVQRITECFLG
jgi:protein transport protein DSL1/ZW10